MDTTGLVILIVLGIFFLLFCIFSFVKWHANTITRWFNYKKLEIDKPILEYAEVLLAERGLAEVQVKKVGFWASIFVGNTYSAKKKLIRVSWYAARRSSVVTLAQLCRLVGLAQMDANGEKGIKSIEIYRWLNWLPILLLPLVIIGLIVDLIALDKIGLYTLVFSAIGIVLTLFTFILAIISIRANRKAYNIGQEIILGTGILNETEEKKIKKLFAAWKRLEIINVLINAFELVYFVFKLIIASLSIIGRK